LLFKLSGDFGFCLVEIGEIRIPAGPKDRKRAFEGGIRFLRISAGLDRLIEPFRLPGPLDETATQRVGRLPDLFYTAKHGRFLRRRHTLQVF
jgi:hypothetical protein